MSRSSTSESPLSVHHGSRSCIIALVAIAAWLLSVTVDTSFAAIHTSTDDQIRIKPVTSDDGGSSSSTLVLKAARKPILVELPLGGNDGSSPSVSDDAVDAIVKAVDENPKRLVTIEFQGFPLRFSDLPRRTKKMLLERGGPEIVGKYDGFVSREVLELIEEAKIARPKAALSVRGLPFEGDEGEATLANIRFAAVIEKLSAFVLDRGVVVSSRLDERKMIGRIFPNAVDLADGRAIIYPVNLSWRLAIEGDVFASLGDSKNTDRSLSMEGESSSGMRADASTGGGSSSGLNDLDAIGFPVA
ncbi:hypothetical protein OAG62_02325, partial [bacterium]|nr:hypothetical protein [bacterium]